MELGADQCLDQGLPHNPEQNRGDGWRFYWIQPVPAAIQGAEMDVVSAHYDLMNSCK